MGWRSCVLAGLLMAGACGGEDDATPSIEGAWIAEDATGFDCVLGFYFGDDGRYEYDTICSLTGGGFGLEAWAGTYEIDGNRITLRATHSTCAGGMPSTDVVTYKLDGDQLVVTAPAASFVLDRVPEDSEGGGTVRHGCFADDGAFIPGGLVAL